MGLEVEGYNGSRRAPLSSSSCQRAPLWVRWMWWHPRRRTPCWYAYMQCRKHRFPTVADTLFIPDNTSVHPGSELCFWARNTVSSHPRTVPSACSSVPIVIQSIQSSPRFLVLAHFFRRSAPRLSTSGCFRTRIHHSSPPSTSHSVRNRFPHHNTLVPVIISLYPL